MDNGWVDIDSPRPSLLQIPNEVALDPLSRDMIILALRYAPPLNLDTEHSIKGYFTVQRLMHFGVRTEFDTVIRHLNHFAYTHDNCTPKVKYHQMFQKMCERFYLNRIYEKWNSCNFFKVVPTFLRFTIPHGWRAYLEYQTITYLKRYRLLVEHMNLIKSRDTEFIPYRTTGAFKTLFDKLEYSTEIENRRDRLEIEQEALEAHEKYLNLAIRNFEFVQIMLNTSDDSEIKESIKLLPEIDNFLQGLKTPYVRKRTVLPKQYACYVIDHLDCFVKLTSCIDNLFFRDDNGKWAMEHEEWFDEERKEMHSTFMQDYNEFRAEKELEKAFEKEIAGRTDSEKKGQMLEFATKNFNFYQRFINQYCNILAFDSIFKCYLQQRELGMQVLASDYMYLDQYVRKETIIMYPSIFIPSGVEVPRFEEILEDNILLRQQKMQIVKIIKLLFGERMDTLLRENNLRYLESSNLLAVSIMVPDDAEEF